MKALAHTTHGALEGTHEGDVFVFRGVPYGAAPVGTRRWRPPMPPEKWRGVRPAKEFGAICPQEAIPEPLARVSVLEVPGRQDEDCLNLNVWTPALDDGRRPTLVWIHGGAFAVGASSEPRYDGGNLARRGAVIVSVNYRLGPLGFLHLADATNGAIPATGNEGLLDVVAALEWVRDNIAGFGGDPGNVTLFGQSAGGTAVSAILAMPAAAGLFHKVISQSGSALSPLRLDDAAALGRHVIDALSMGADDVDALLAVGPDKLFAATPSIIREIANRGVNVGPTAGQIRPGPVIDGDILPLPVLDALRRGGPGRVVLMAGTTRDEASSSPVAADVSLDGLPDALAALWGDGFDFTELTSVYVRARAARFASTHAADIAAAIATDLRNRIPTTRLLDAHRSSQPPGYHYVFTWTSPRGDGARKATHGVDYPLIFGTHAIDDRHASFYGEGPAADALSAAVADAWVAFARTGDPSTDTLGPWPAYADTRATMMIGERTHVVEAPFEEERAAWEAHSDAQLSDASGGGSRPSPMHHR